MIILLDNYDSFTWNLWHFLQELGSEVKIVKKLPTTSTGKILRRNLRDPN